MKTARLRSSSSKSEHRSIALVTVAFIFASAALHLALGGTIHAPWRHQEVEQQPMPIVIERVPTPRPTPTPTQKPTPQPVPKETPLPVMHRVKPRVLPTKPVRPATIHPPAVTTSTGGKEQPPMPLQTGTETEQPQSPPTPIDARDIIISARFINRVEPNFPEVAINQGVEGTVIVLVTIGPDGAPSDVRVWQSSGNAALDRAALQAAQQSTYAPPEVNGEPATQTYRVIYTFFLQ